MAALKQQGCTAIRPMSIILDVGRAAYGDGVEFGARMYARLRFPDWHIARKSATDENTYDRTQPDGMIVQIASRNGSPLLRSQPCPVVNVVACDGPLDVPTVIPDDVRIGRMAGDHLVSQGLKHFGYYAQPLDFSARQRGEGYSEAVRAAGYEVVEYHIFAQRQNASQLAHWLLTLPRPAGVYTATDIQAHEVIGAALRSGIRVPHDLAVIGTGDDTAICETSVVPISSIAIDAEQVGHQAAALLDKLMRGNSVPTTPIRLAPLCVVDRDSTSLASSQDPMVAHAVVLLHKRHSEPLTVEWLAAACGVSTRTLYRRFERIMGRGPMEELRRIRIERAKQLLWETNKKIIDVALATGFAGAPQFSSLFRQTTGTSPTAFRNMHRPACDQTA